MMEYTKNYKIYTPQLKSQSGRSVRINRNLGNFTYDFSTGVLDQMGLHGVSFCFFILWSGRLSGDLNPHSIWLKKEISIEGDGIINLNDTDCFDRKFFQDEPLSVVKSKREFFDRYGLESSYLVIRDLKGNFDLREEQSVAIEVVYDPVTNRLKKTPISLGTFQSMLVENSNGPVSIKKPLNYYETDLEKYLQMTCQETGALFPGDCDLLLYDNDAVCQGILEYKKTTDRDHRSIEEQSFLNYLDHDINKYTRLNILRNYLSAKDGRTIPFVIVFYSVKQTEEHKIKIEVIDPTLRLETSAVFEIGSDPVSNQELILQKIREVCNA